MKREEMRTAVMAAAVETIEAGLLPILVGCGMGEDEWAVEGIRLVSGLFEYGPHRGEAMALGRAIADDIFGPGGPEDEEEWQDDWFAAFGYDLDDFLAAVDDVI
jgi:hypothetical protein